MEEQFKKIWKKEDESGFKEKHVPVVKIEGEKIEVKVGEIEHPSEPGHFIQWISLLDGEVELARVYLTHGSRPRAAFFVKEMPKNLKVRIFCNLHGTWEG